MAPYRIEWLDEARADVRVLDRAAAMRIFEGILHFARTGSGKVMPLHGNMAGSVDFNPRGASAAFEDNLSYRSL
jgi:hypothetical protein